MTDIRAHQLTELYRVDRLARRIWWQITRLIVSPQLALW
jgi:hypothetical protein